MESTNTHGIDSEKVLSCTEDNVQLVFRVDRKCDFFNGHFQTVKIFPAVGQIAVVNCFAEKYLHIENDITSIKRVKFTAPLLPDTDVLLDISYSREKGTFSFTMSDASCRKKIYSSGKIS